MDEPVDTAAVAAHLKATQGLGSIDIPSAYHSNWLDIRAPSSTCARLIDIAKLGRPFYGTIEKTGIFAVCFSNDL